MFVEPAPPANPIALPDAARSTGVREHFVAGLLILLGSGLVLFNTPRETNTSTNVMSRWATVEAVADHGTYAIDATKYTATIDKVKVGEHFYSSKPPVLPTIVAGVYWVYRSITGDTLGSRGSWAAWVSTVATIGVLHVLLLVVFYRFAALLIGRSDAVLLALAAMCFACIGAGYATTLNNHTPAAFLSVASFYYAYRVRHGIDATRKHWLLSGLLAGALPTIDLPSAALSAALFVYLLRFDVRKTLRWFLPATLPFVVWHLATSWIATGSLVPIYLRGDVYQYEGSYWSSPRGLEAQPEPKWMYAFHVLLGHHGLFSMTPLFGLGVLGLAGVLRERHKLWSEALVVLVSSVVLLAFYILRTHNYGGVCIGVRWFVSYMPLLFLFFGIWLARRSLTSRVLLVVAVLFLVSQFNAIDALHSPWAESQWQAWWRQTFGSPNVPG